MTPLIPDDLLIHERNIYNKMNEVFDLTYKNNDAANLTQIGEWLSAFEIAKRMGVGKITRHHTGIIVKLIRMIGVKGIVRRTGSGILLYVLPRHTQIQENTGEPDISSDIDDKEEWWKKS